MSGMMLLVTACLILGAGPVLAATNLLPDGGFEEGRWTLTTWDHGQARHEVTTEARTGAKAVKLTGIKAEPAAINVLALSPAVDIAAEEEYVLSLWYRTQGNPGASVSVITVKEPFAKGLQQAQQTAYVTQALPPSEGWRPWSWRFRTAPNSVQLVAAVRCGAPGSVWYDDVALLRATEASLRLVEAGTITRLPHSRRLRAALTVGDSPWRLHLFDRETARVLGTQQGRGDQKEVRLSYAAPAEQPLRLVLEEATTGAVLAVEELEAPPLLQLKVTSPRYRNTLYLSRRPKAVRGQLICAADARVRETMRYAVEPAKGEAPRWRPLRAVNAVAVAVPPAFAGRALTLAVRLQGVPGRTRLAHEVKVVPPAPAGTEVLSGDHGETLVNGRPFFPAGFYGVPDSDEARPIPQAGYNVALTYMTDVESCRKWLDRCRQLGLLGIVSVPNPFVAAFDEAALRRAIRAVKEHPALLAYYLFDEPYPSTPGATPAELKRAYDVVADEDPYHPIGVCLNVPDFTDDYIDCYDVVLPDPYPLVKRVQPLTLVSDNLAETRRALAGTKPIWVVPQAFGSDVVEGIGDPEQYRTPTPDQERCMTYLALTQGVQGVVYYCYHVYTRYDAAKAKAGEWPYVLGGHLPDQQPKLWGALVGLGAEMKHLGPALLRPGAESGRTKQVHGRRLPGAQRGAAWLLAVNPEPDAAVVTLPVRAKAAVARFGNGTVTAARDGLRVTLPPLGTLAAELTAP